jgi:hypothetical protein
MSEQNDGGFRGFVFSRWGVGFLVLTAVAGYFLWAEHEAHVKLAIPYLPYLLLLLCPLMHLFMHQGHGGHDHGSKGHTPKTPKPNDGEQP